MEAGWAEGLRMEAENASCTDATEDPPVADLVEQPPLFHAAVAAHRRHRHRHGGGRISGGGIRFYLHRNRFLLEIRKLKVEFRTH